MVLIEGNSSASSPVKKALVVCIVAATRAGGTPSHISSHTSIITCSGHRWLPPRLPKTRSFLICLRTWLICSSGSSDFSEHSASLSFNSATSFFKFLHASSLLFDVTLCVFIFFCSVFRSRLLCFTSSDISSTHSCIKLSSSVFFFIF